ncbi:MAG TPA: hypothetical protein VMH22_10890 [bacterium]|nr:hypothetical protein [bacterium]
MAMSVILIGPKQLGEDHAQYCREHGSTAIQYSASVQGWVVRRLQEMPRPFNLYIYVPKRYTCNGRAEHSSWGVGWIEYRAEIVDFSVDRNRQASPWPTIAGPNWYDKHQDRGFRYEYWFKAKAVVTERHQSEEFDVELKDRTTRRYCGGSFGSTWRRGAIVFARTP